MITWLPISELPDALKDGREVLVWDVESGAMVAEWVLHMSDPAAWKDVVGLNPLTPTHFAEINPPCE